MQYVLLIYDEEKTWKHMAEGDRARAHEEYMTFTADIKKEGKHRAGQALQPISTATCVRQKAGKVITTDGPYAETKEQLGGFYMVEAQSLDEAISIAARIPSVRYGGTVEVRPVQKYDGQ